MSKYFYVYNIAGVEDSIVKMFNTDTGAMGEKSALWHSVGNGDPGYTKREAEPPKKFCLPKALL